MRRYGYISPAQGQNQGQPKQALKNPGPPSTYTGGDTEVCRVVIYDVHGRPVEDRTMAPVNLLVGDTLTVNWTCPAVGNAYIAQPQTNPPGNSITP